MELLCYLATMFNIQHYPTDLVSRVCTRLIDLFTEFHDDTYYAEFAPQDDPVRHLRLVVNREDGLPMTARDFMDFHHYLSAACYTDPILKDLIMFDDFYFAKDKPLTIVTFGFDLF